LILKAVTPAHKYEDGEDFVPASRFTVFSHQFSSITGAGPVTGPIIAAMFGWLPALLWMLIGGVFFGAVQDFTALYASVKNEGRSMGMLIEDYVGKTGRTPVFCCSVGCLLYWFWQPLQIFWLIRLTALLLMVKIYRERRQQRFHSYSFWWLWALA